MNDGLVIENVLKRFGGVQAVGGVHLTVPSGTVCAIVGDNGAGKTTLFNLISGVLAPDQGRIVWNGNRVDGLPEWRVARSGVGRLYQEVRVFPKLSLLDNVMAGFPRQPGESLWNLLIHPRWVWKTEHALKDKALQLLDFVGLSNDVSRWAETLSLGQQKLLAIARLLATDARLLLLDEPTAGIASLVARTVLGVIRRLRDDGRAVLIIEHDRNVVNAIADTIVTMDRGKIVTSCPNRATLSGVVIQQDSPVHEASVP